MNRGFLYGDAIYEVWRTHARVVFAFEEHWQRLEQSARALHMDLPLDRAQFISEARRTVTAYLGKNPHAGEFYIRLQITRGDGAIGLDTSFADKSSFVILVQPLKEQPEKWWKTGMRLSVANTMHRLHTDTVNPAWKTGNYLNNILCLREAQSRGADEVLMTNLSGEITEAAVSNVFFVRGQTLITPPLSVGILAGITRRFVMEQVAPHAGIHACEEVVRVDNLSSFQECFITSTTKEIASVASIDDTRYSVGEDSITQKLRNAFNSLTREYGANHSELKVR